MNFVEMSVCELEVVEGGGWKEAGAALLGTVGLATSIPVTILNPGAGLTLAGLSAACLDTVF